MQTYGSLVLGIIEHHPRSNLAGDVGLGLIKRYNTSAAPDTWEKGAEMWRSLADDYPDDPQILGNAGSYFTSDLLRTAKLEEGLDLLERASVLDPYNPRWEAKIVEVQPIVQRYAEANQQAQQDPRKPEPVASSLPPEELTETYLEHMQKTDYSSKEEAGKALQNLEEAYRLTEESKRPTLRVNGIHIMERMARAAFDAGEMEKAKSCATTLLESLDRDIEGWNYGNVIHDMNIILGRVALREGDIEAAKHHLVEAGRTPGSPQLESHGPELKLAQELLDQGERETVLQYLALCSMFWREDDGRLNRWTKALREGNTPDLDIAK
jgi:tetratricopeptide (TPR) repeat protein